MGSKRRFPGVVGKKKQENRVSMRVSTACKAWEEGVLSSTKPKLAPKATAVPQSHPPTFSYYLSSPYTSSSKTPTAKKERELTSGTSKRKGRRSVELPAHRMTTWREDEAKPLRWWKGFRMEEEGHWSGRKERTRI